MKTPITLSVLMATALVALGLPVHANADTITLNAINRGWHEDGVANGTFSTNNYIAGGCEAAPCGGAGQNDYRNWFKFDLSGFTDTVVAATLHLNVPAEIGYISTSAASETYTLFDIAAGNVAGLGTGSVAIWTDLGSGTSYGSHVATNADLGTNVSIVLNAAALAAINGSFGSTFALGGAITTLNGAVDNEYLFGFTNFGAVHVTSLELTTVPEPATLLVLGTGLVGLAYKRRRRQ